MRPPLITSSRLKVFRRCRREELFRYRLGRATPATAAMEFGTLIHKGLEAWWLTWPDCDARLGAALDTMRGVVGVDPFDLAKAEAMLMAYDTRWGAQPFTVLGVEKEFRAELPGALSWEEPQRIGGKLDAIVRDSTGCVFIVEHKCLVGSTRVFDHETGRFWTLAELAAERRQPLLTAMSREGYFESARAKVTALPAPRWTYVVKTASGRIITASDNHPFWTPEGWVMASHLRPGGWVATPKHMGSDIADGPLSDAAVKLIGYLIGDGCMSNMSFCKRDEKVLVDVARCGYALGETPVRHDSKTRAPTLRFSRVGVVAKLMGDVGLAGHGSATKRIPQGVRLSDRQCGLLLGALWSTDGCIDLRRAAGGPRIIYTSVSERLCRDIQELLQRLGIVSHFRAGSVAYRGARREVFTVQVVSRASKARFLEMALQSYIPVIRSSVPLQWALDAIPDSPQGADNRMRPKDTPGIWWDRIEVVLPGDEQVLYDVEVPGPANFVAEGIVTHNTSSEDISPGSAYWARLRMDGQVSLYHLGAEALGYHNIHGVLYDVLVKPGQKPLRATAAPRMKKDGTPYAGQRLADETPDEYRRRLIEAMAPDLDSYFARQPVVRLEAERARHLAELQAEARELAAAAPLPNPDSCVRYGSTCSYFGVCTGGRRLDEYPLLTNVHPELSEEL